MSETAIPTDLFSRRRRELMDNPGAIRSASMLNLQDFYGNLETWNIETFRYSVPGKKPGDDAQAVVEALVQRNTVEGALRLVLPPKVMAALGRQQAQVVTVARRRAARRALDTRRERGDTLGNPEALKKARRARKAVR